MLSITGLLGGIPAGIRPVSNFTGFTTAVAPPKRPKRDFSNFHTPSGNYYCSACNMTLNSDVQMSQHIDSKKHRTNHSTATKDTPAIEQASN